MPVVNSNKKQKIDGSHLENDCWCEPIQKLHDELIRDETDRLKEQANAIAVLESKLSELKNERNKDSRKMIDDTCEIYCMMFRLIKNVLAGNPVIFAWDKNEKNKSTVDDILFGNSKLFDLHGSFHHYFDALVTPEVKKEMKLRLCHTLHHVQYKYTRNAEYVIQVNNTTEFTFSAEYCVGITSQTAFDGFKRNTFAYIFNTKTTDE